MKTKKFGLKDFPEERIRILFKSDKIFLDETITYFGSKERLAQFLSISPETIYHWKKSNLFIPLSHIKKIVRERNLVWIEVENKVAAYKGPNSALPINNPKLPILESPGLFAIIAHLIGDGSVNKNGIPIYTNTNRALLNHFQDLIRSVFGEVKASEYRIRSGAYQLRFPQIIADLITSFYDINFSSLRAKVPNRLMDLPTEFSVDFIRAFADDEATVDYNHRMNIYSRNKDILLSIRRLLVEKLSFKDIPPVLSKSNTDYYITIRTKEIEKYHSVIGFNHSIKKKKLSAIIKIRKTSNSVRRKDNQTRNEILQLLSSCDRSTEELIQKLRLRKGNLTIPLKELKEKGLISQMKEGPNIIWTIMEG